MFLLTNGDRWISGGYDSWLPAGCLTLTLDSDSKNIHINFIHADFFFWVNTPNHWSSTWSIISELWSIWNNFLDATKLALKLTFMFVQLISICDLAPKFFAFFIYINESGVAFSDLLKITLTLTLRNLQISSASDSWLWLSALLMTKFRYMCSLP